MKLTNAKKAELIEGMIDFLIKESGIKLNFDYAKLDKRRLLNYLLMLHSTENLGSYFYSLQDQLLKDENDNYTNTALLKFKKDVAYVSADVTSINADLVVHFSNNLIPMQMQDDADTKILLKAGIQLGYEYYKEFKENGFLPNFSEPYICDGYNLPAKNIAKVLIQQGEECLPNIKQIFNFAVENNLVTIFFDLTNANITEKDIINIKPKNIKLIFKQN